MEIIKIYQCYRKAKRRIAGIMEDILGSKYSKSTISRISKIAKIQRSYIYYNRGLKSNVRERDIEEISIDANKMFKCDSKEEGIIRFNDLLMLTG